MILGRQFFVTPSDSVAIIAANAQEAIPYFKSGPKVNRFFKNYDLIVLTEIYLRCSICRV